jgi:hypothetical protein
MARLEIAFLLKCDEEMLHSEADDFTNRYPQRQRNSRAFDSGASPTGSLGLHNIVFSSGPVALLQKGDGLNGLKWLQNWPL